MEIGRARGREGDTEGEREGDREGGSEGDGGEKHVAGPLQANIDVVLIMRVTGLTREEIVEIAK